MEQPKEIYMFSVHVVTYKTPMIQNSEGNWEADESYREIIKETVSVEWFEDEEGTKLIMEEEEER